MLYVQILYTCKHKIKKKNEQSFQIHFPLKPLAKYYIYLTGFSNLQ